MANICFMEVAFYVPSSDSTKVNNLLNLHKEIAKVKASDKPDFAHLLSNMKLKQKDGFSARGVIYDVGEMREEGVYSVFYMDSGCDWSPQEDFLDILTQFAGVQYVYCAEECDSDCFCIVGNLEDGELFFPHNYSTDIWENSLFIEGKENHEEGCVRFETVDEILSFLRTLNTDFDSDELDEWEEYLFFDCEIGHIRRWERSLPNCMIRKGA